VARCRQDGGIVVKISAGPAAISANPKIDGAVNLTVASF